jgi:hypothetical protein
VLLVGLKSNRPQRYAVAMITTRATIFAAVAYLLGLLIGSMFAPVTLWPRLSLERDNTALRRELKLYKQLMAEYESERTEIRKALKAATLSGVREWSWRPVGGIPNRKSLNYVGFPSWSASRFLSGGIAAWSHP